MTFRDGFTIGDWTIYPLEGRLVSAHGESHVQPKSMDVLLCLVDSAGSVVERDVILHNVWGETAPTDEPLTRCIGELRRALGDTRSEPRYIATIPKRGYRLLEEALPLNSELPTPESVPADDSAPGDAQSQSLPRRFLTRLAIAAVVIAVIIPIVISQLSDDDRDTNVEFTNQQLYEEGFTPSVAVLPFANFSADPDNEYFSDGLTEAILHTLARLPEVQVTARTTSFMYKNTQGDVREIGRQLGVSHILEGSVQRSGNRVRVTAQLIRSSDGFHVWSHSYDSELDDIFAVQDEISSRVSTALLSTFQEDPREITYSVVETFDPQAYDLYLHAVSENQVASFESFQRAEQYLTEALEIDQGFKDARLALSNIYVSQAYTGMVSWDVAMPKARLHVQNLLDDDPDNFRALAVAAIIDGYDALGVHDFAAIRRAAISLEELLDEVPNVIGIYQWIALFRLEIGDYDIALKAIENGLEIDRLSHWLYSKQGEVLYALRRYDQSAKAFERVRQLSANAPGGYSSGGTVAKAARDYESYVPLMIRSMNLDSSDHELPLRFAGTLYSLGMHEEAEPFFQRGRDLAPDSPATMRFSLDRDWALENYAAVRDRAADMLENDIENRLGAYSAALAFYVQAQRKLGASAEVPPFLASLSASAIEPNAKVSESREYLIKRAMIEALFDLDIEQAEEHATYLYGYERQAFPVIAQASRARVFQQVAIGQRARAIDVALEEDLRDAEIAFGLATYASDDYRFSTVLESLLDDEFLAARIDEIDAQRSSAATEMGALLAEHATTLPWEE